MGPTLGGLRLTRSPNLAKRMGPGRNNSTVHTPTTAGDASLGGQRSTRSPNGQMMGPGRYNSIGQTPKTAGDAALGGQKPTRSPKLAIRMGPTLDWQRTTRPPNVAIRMDPGRCILTNNTPRLPLRSQGDKTSEIRFDTAGATTCTSKKRSDNAGIRKIFRLNRYQAFYGPCRLTPLKLP